MTRYRTIVDRASLDEAIEAVASRLSDRAALPGFVGDAEVARAARRLHAENIVACVLAALNVEPEGER